METWRAVVGYETVYEVSDLGAIRRLGDPCDHCGSSTGRRMAWRGGDDKRPYVTLSTSGLTRNRYVHVLVAEAFLPPRPTPKHEVNHRDGNRRNPRADNLEWMTRSENIRHAIRLGLMRPPRYAGEAHPGAKLTLADVREIRGLRGIARQADLAERFGVSVVTISKIQLGETWTDPAYPIPTPGQRRGSEHGNARLTEDQVAEIRALASSMTQREIGALFGIDQGHVSQIVRGKVWRHVQPRSPQETTTERVVADGRTL